MQGDALVIDEEHVVAAGSLLEVLLPRAVNVEGVDILTIGGESGAGKSEIAFVLSRLLREEGVANVIVQQDDFFRLPPASNTQKRKEDLTWVGPGEVRLDLLDGLLREILGGAPSIAKPLVFFQENRIGSETIDLRGIRVVIVEGTYTALLENTHTRIFIDRTHDDQRVIGARRRRGRDIQDSHLLQVLGIEHAIIREHKALADIVITPDYAVEVIHG